MLHKKEYTILALSWFFGFVLLIFFVPQGKQRQAQVSFLFKQLLTWLFGLIVVEKGLIRYPIRIFSKAHKTSFTFEYFIYPALCSMFNIYFPKNKNVFIRGLYYLFHTSLITVFEIYAVKKTNLIIYKKWAWYWSFITIWGTYYISRLYYTWFFKNNNES